MACLLIAGLLAAAVGLSLGGVYRQARMTDVVERFRLFERQCREHALRFDQPAELRFNLETGVVTCIEREASSTQESLMFALPAGFSFRSIRSAAGPSNRRVSLSCSGQGHTPSYAVHLSGPESRHVWLVTAGLSGQIVEVDHEQQAQHILETLTSGGFSESPAPGRFSGNAGRFAFPVPSESKAAAGAGPDAH